MIYGVLVFAALKYLGYITLGWWWIIAAAVIGAIPLGMTGAFVVMKLMGLFAVPVAWWMIIIPLFFDLVGSVDTIHDMIQS